MSVDQDIAFRYRQHAEELRIIAAESPSPDMRESLLKIADDYDQMASSLEAIDRSNKALARRIGPGS